MAEDGIERDQNAALSASLSEWGNRRSRRSAQDLTELPLQQQLQDGGNGQSGSVLDPGADYATRLRQAEKYLRRCVGCVWRGGGRRGRQQGRKT